MTITFDDILIVFWIIATLWAWGLLANPVFMGILFAISMACPSFALFNEDTWEYLKGKLNVYNC